MKKDDLKTLGDLLQLINIEESNFSLFNHLQNDFIWETVSEKDFVSQTLAFAKFLELKGLKKSDRIVIFSRNSASWFVVDLACHLLGVITVPIFSGTTKESMQRQVLNSHANYAFIYGEKEWLETESIHEKFDFIITKEYKSSKGNYILNDLEPVSMTNKEIKERYNSVQEDDIATICYTSGSYDANKGIALTHKNIVSRIQAAREHYYLPRSSKVFSFLPVSHIFQRVTNYIYLAYRLEIFNINNADMIMLALKEIKPDFVTTVPRLLEKIYLGLEGYINSLGFLKRNVGKIAITFAKTKPENFVLIKKALKPIYKKLLKGLGVYSAQIVVGGAKLNEKINHFFLNLGLEVYQAYGLTETSSFVTMNSKEHFKANSVGKITRGIELKIAEDSEILVRGECVGNFGYNTPEFNELYFSKDAWFKTGDLGYLEEDFLFITGRKKQLMKSSTGKYISKASLQLELALLPKVEHALIIGEGKPYLTAIFFVDKTYKESDLEFISNQLKKVNKKFHNWEQIKEFQVIKKELSISKGELTMSYKLCETFLMKKYKKEIQQLYNK